MPKLGIVVAIEEAYTQCSKALIRSDLWNPERHIDRSELPSSGEILRSLNDPSFDADAVRPRARRALRPPRRPLLMRDEAPLQETEHGLVPQGDGWFVLNAREAPWWTAEGRSAICGFEGEAHFPQFGVNLSVLAPGQAMAMYHWEADQEDFLVLSGEALLIVEGEERPLRAWDFVHCPAGTNHVIVGAGEGPAVVLAVGARDRLGRQPGLGRLPGRRDGAAPRGRRRAGDDRAERGLRPLQAPPPGRLPRRLAARLAGSYSRRLSGRRISRNDSSRFICFGAGIGERGCSGFGCR